MGRQVGVCGSGSALQTPNVGTQSPRGAAAINVFLFFSPSLRSLTAPADINLNSPNRGMASEPSDSLSDVPVGGAMGNPANPAPLPGLTEEEAEELRGELAKVVSATIELFLVETF